MGSPSIILSVPHALSIFKVSPTDSQGRSKYERT